MTKKGYFSDFSFWKRFIKFPGGEDIYETISHIMFLLYVALVLTFSETAEYF